ncbi:hypothetical protein ACB098_03G191400 [Castanea mollissima]
MLMLCVLFIFFLQCVASHPDTRMLFLNGNLFICESNILKNKEHIMTI